MSPWVASSTSAVSIWVAPHPELDPGFMDPEYPFEWAGAYVLPVGSHELVIGHDDEKHVHGPEEDHHHHHHVRGMTTNSTCWWMPVSSLSE